MRHAVDYDRLTQPADLYRVDGFRSSALSRSIVHTGSVTTSQLERPPTDLARTWLALAVSGRRQHGGNDGYDDDPGVHYSWDSTVANHAAISEGDRIVVWDKSSLLGASVIRKIETGRRTKPLRRCPWCGKSGFKSRIDLKPEYKCYKCKQTFDVPTEVSVEVVTYRSLHEADWLDLNGYLTAATIRTLADSPDSQLSIREARWSAFVGALGAKGDGGLAAPLTGRLEDLGGGHRRAMVRVRVGQGRFRHHLLDQHGANCAVTGPAPAAVLEAAHLYSYAETGRHEHGGGLLLRSDVHRLFDLGLLTIDPQDLTVWVAPIVRSCDDYGRLHGRTMCVPAGAAERRWLSIHWRVHGPVSA